MILSDSIKWVEVIAVIICMTKAIASKKSKLYGKVILKHIWNMCTGCAEGVVVYLPATTDIAVAIAMASSPYIGHTPPTYKRRVLQGIHIHTCRLVHHTLGENQEASSFTEEEEDRS